MPKSIKRSPFERTIVESLPDHSKVGSNAEKGWIEPFLGAIMQGSSVTDAVNLVNVHITLPYKTRKTDEAFRTAWQEAAEVGTEFLEQEAARRAYHGTLKPVFHKGEQCGLVREYSDTLMIFLLKARRPDKYREGVEDQARGNITINVNVVAVDGRPEQDAAQFIEVVPIVDGGEQDRAGVPEAVTVPPE